MVQRKLSINDYVSNNFEFIKKYFNRAIGNEKIFVCADAIEALKKLPLYANGPAITQWNGWIEKYISSYYWERCKTALRQHRLMQKRKYKYRTFRIPFGLSCDIEIYATIAGLTKFAALKQAIDVAMKALGANAKMVAYDVDTQKWKITNK